LDDPCPLLNISLPKIYAITDTGISGISHEEQVARLIAGGIRLIQLRAKNASSREFYESTRAVVSYARRHGTKVIINDRVDIAAAAGADGVHLGQDDLAPELARKILGSKAIIGYSTHSLEQVRIALRYPVDYLAIGPVFRTKTKVNSDPVIGIERLQEVSREIGEMPLVAIGGINLTNLNTVFEAGADSIAVVGGLISNAEKISEMAKAFIFQSDSPD
jgi:thiamine-phosphate pyrophosphorylase